MTQSRISALNHQRNVRAALTAIAVNLALEDQEALVPAQVAQAVRVQVLVTLALMIQDPATRAELVLAMPSSP